MSQIPLMMSGASTALSQVKAKPSATNCMSFRAIKKPNRTLSSSKLSALKALTVILPPFSKGGPLPVVTAFALRLLVV